MKKIGFIIFIAAVVVGVTVGNLFSFGKTEVPIKFNFNDRVEGSGSSVTQDRDVRDFHRVEVGGIFNVVIIAGKDHSVQVEADDNLLQHIVTEVTDGTLSISLNEQVKSRNVITVRVTAPDIESVEASGASKVSLADVGNSVLRVGGSGASKIELSGATGEFTAEVSGASKIDAEKLSAVKAHIDASGASKVLLNVSERLEVDSSGASSVVYSGSPTEVEKRISGGASVSQR